MFRHSCEPRRGWEDIIVSEGLVYWETELPGGEKISYWNESNYYEFSAAEVELFETATLKLHRMAVETAKYMVSGDDFTAADFGLPEGALEVLGADLVKNPFSLYGRFDFGFDSVSGDLKMLEYNADTPTGVIEMCSQWNWLEDKFPNTDQFNSFHDRLVRQWGRGRFRSDMVYFGYCGEAYPEDSVNVQMLQACAEKAGLRTKLLEMQHIGWDAEKKVFVDASGTPDSFDEYGVNRRIDVCFKLYPWEDMLSEAFGRFILDDPGSVQWVEPLWKELLSNKVFLAAIHNVFPGHEYVLPAQLGSADGLEWWVGKPLHGREGSNIILHSPLYDVKMPGAYGAEGYVYQKWFDIPMFDGRYPVVGSWMVGDHPAGISVRDSSGPITDPLCQFVPHVMDSPRPSDEQVEEWLQ